MNGVEMRAKNKQKFVKSRGRSSQAKPIEDISVTDRKFNSTVVRTPVSPLREQFHDFYSLQSTPSNVAS